MLENPKVQVIQRPWTQGHFWDAIERTLNDLKKAKALIWIRPDKLTHWTKDPFFAGTRLYLIWIRGKFLALEMRKATGESARTRLALSDALRDLGHRTYALEAETPNHAVKVLFDLLLKEGLDGVMRG